MSLHLSEFPLYEEIRDEYMILRQDMPRKKAVMSLKKKYGNEINDTDDAVFFWLGIASAQSALGELNAEYKEKTLAAINAANNDELLFEEDEIEFLYSKSSKTKRIFPASFNWKIGDVYLYELNSECAKSAHVDDCSILLYVADNKRFSHYDINPVVYLMLWLSREIPQTKENIESCGFLEIDKPFRNKDKKACRKVLTGKTKEEIDDFSASLKYVGNYSGIRVPLNEADLTDYNMFISLQFFDEQVCQAFMSGNLYYLSEKL